MEGQMEEDLAIRQEYQVFIFVFERESMCGSRVGGANGEGENES